MRVYRAFQTTIEMCEDRGYELKHPKSIAVILNRHRNDGGGETESPSSSSSAACLPFPWFKNFFQEEARKTYRQEEEKEGVKRELPASHGAHTPLGIQNITLVFKRRAEKKGDAAAENRNGKNSEQKEENESVILKKEGQEEENDLLYDSKMIVFFLCGAREKSSLSLKDVLECRREAIDRHASRAIIVASSISSAVRRETKETCGVAPYIALLPDEKKGLLSYSTEKATSGIHHHTSPTVRGEQGSSSLLTPSAAFSTSPPPVFRQIELFDEQELLFNPSRHETVPRHVILSEAETQALLEKYQVHRNQLPRISLADPMVKYIGATRGMVVHIQRKSEDSGPYSMYRQVV